LGSIGFGCACLPTGQPDKPWVCGARNIDLDLRVPDRKDIRTTVKEVSGAGTIKSGRINAPVGDTWTEVFFALEGSADERVRIEVHHGDNIERVRPCVPDALYSVSGTGSCDPKHSAAIIMG